MSKLFVLLFLAFINTVSYAEDCLGELLLVRVIQRESLKGLTANQIIEDIYKTYKPASKEERVTIEKFVYLTVANDTRDYRTILSIIRPSCTENLK